MNSSQKFKLTNQNPETVDNPDWQSKRHTPVDRLQYMLFKGLFSDVKFIVGDERKGFKAHKNFLAMTSPVFETMFFGSVPQTQPILIPDIQPATFKELLQYIYTDVVNLKSMDHADCLYYAANKYMLPILSDRCTQFVKENLSPKNVFRALEFGIDHDDEALKERCFTLLRSRVRESYKTAGIEEISEATLLTLVQMDALDINEIDLFKAVQGWANVTSGPHMRKVLNKVIGHIRFLAMTPEEFATGPANSGILTDSECLAIFKNLNSRVHVPLPHPLSNERKTRGPRAEGLKRYHRSYGETLSWFY